MEAVYGLLIIVGVMIISVAIFIHFVPTMLWVSAWASGVKVSMFTLIGMRLRRIPPAKIINPLIKAVKAGLDVGLNQLETHYLAGGNAERVVDALIIAKKSGVDLSFEEAAAFDLGIIGEDRTGIDLAQMRNKSG